MPVALNATAVRPGRVRGRYFRENFAQGGFDLAQVLPELVTNADAAIAASGRAHGRITLSFGAPDPAFVGTWRRELRRLNVPGFPVWRFEVRCSDDGEGMDEVTLAGHEGRPGARHLFGDVPCQAIESLQRAALESPRPQLVVKADRSGLNEHHPLVLRLHAAIDRVLRPILDAEERRAGAHRLSTGRAVRARDEVGLRELNDALRAAFDAPGSAGFTRGERPSDRPVVAVDAADVDPTAGGPSSSQPTAAAQTMAPIRFKQPLMRLHPGEQRSASLLFDPARIPTGTPVIVTADVGLSFRIWRDAIVPDANRLGWSGLSGTLRARATVDPGAGLTVIAEAAGHLAELEVLIVRHRGGGWVREIARKDEDSQIEAHFDPETGVVTVFEGRPEFRALERAARRAGLSRARVREYLPLRMLEVEAAANAVYAWAAERVLEHRLGGQADATSGVRPSRSDRGSGAAPSLP